MDGAIIFIPVSLHSRLTGKKEKRKKNLFLNIMKFRIRVDDYGIGAKTSMYPIIETAKEHVLVRHDIGDNPHWHLYVDNPNFMSPQSVRYYLRKHTDNPTDYSVKKCDDDRVDEYVQYLFNTKHGNVATIESSLFDDNRLQQCRARADEVTEEFTKRKKDKPKTLYEIAMYVDAATKDDSDLIANVIKALHKFCKCHDDHLIIKVLTTIQSKRDIEFVVERIRRKII